MSNESQPSITIKDVARECGVSATTVSLALRNHPRISEETKARIRESVKELGYKRNPLVSALMSNLGRSHPPAAPAPLAAVYNTTLKAAEGLYHGELWRGMCARAAELGFAVERFFLRDKKIGSARRLSDILYARGISGLVIPPLAQAGGHLSLEWDRFSSVAIGYSMLRPALHRVCPDQYQSIRLALHKTRHYGYSRPGLVINGYSGLRTLHLWSSGFYGYEYGRKSRGVVPVLEFGEVDSQALLRWFEKYRPDVIISSGKEMAVWNALKKAGVSCPEDAGFVSLCRCKQFTTVAGINESEFTVGAASVEQVVHQLYCNERGIPSRAHVLQIAPSWEDGQTCIPRNKAAGTRGTRG
jgi:LacI family transcriptional regulator